MNDFLRALLNLPPEASSYARGIDLLHFCVISATMAGAAFVFFLALYYLLRYRRRTPGELSPRVETAAPVEIFIIAGLQLLFLVFWVIGAAQYNHLMTAPEDAVPVYVTGKQWMWKFAYPDGRATMDVLTVPVHRKIKLVMTSRDVIHSFYVPAFRMKHDVVPGRYYTAWFEAEQPGEYPIECAEYCGLDHSRMLGKVQVLSDADYAAWQAAHPVVAPHATDTPNPVAGVGGDEVDDLATMGRDVAARRGCLNCHTLDGQPHIGPSWANLFDNPVALANGQTVVADEAYLTRSMMDPQAEIVAGFQPVMPTYRGILSQPEVAALLELMKSIQKRPLPRSVTLPTVVPESKGQPQEPQP